MDPVLYAMLLLKDNWSLNGNLATGSIHFGTRFYDKKILLPQIVISPLGGDASPPQDCGTSAATYPSNRAIGFDIWVRPKQDSASSIGWAKNAVYQIRKEVDRIFRSGSRIATGSVSEEDTFLSLGEWRRRDDIRKKPPLFHLSGTVLVSKYIKEI